MIIRMLYCGKKNQNVVTFDTSNKTFTDNPVRGFWDMGCDLFVEAKVSKDVTETKERLIYKGYTRADWID